VEKNSPFAYTAQNLSMIAHVYAHTAEKPRSALAVLAWAKQLVADEHMDKLHDVITWLLKA
jgi:hypothetical protein